MPTVEPPRQQEPMEAAATMGSSHGEIVTQQPVCSALAPQLLQED